VSRLKFAKLSVTSPWERRTRELTAVQTGRERSPWRKLALGAGILPLFFPMSLPARAAAAQQPIDTAHSHVTVTVYKTGLFAPFAHNHEIDVPLASGSANPTDPASVEFRVRTASLRVLDPGTAAKTRAEIQQTMLGPKVLDADQYPEIRFQSRRVEQTGKGQWRVVGDLTLHGQTRPVTFDVSEQAGVYRGAASIRQTDFGIKPVRIAGGTVKVKDVVRVQFEIRLSGSADAKAP
jgi:polyisoprenoid-binding protein YceI